MKIKMEILVDYGTTVPSPDGLGRDVARLEDALRHFFVTPIELAVEARFDQSHTDNTYRLHVLGEGVI